MSRKLEMVSGGCEGDGEAIVAVMVVLLEAGGVCFLGCESRCVLEMRSGVLDDGMALERWYSFA